MSTYHTPYSLLIDAYEEYKESLPDDEEPLPLQSWNPPDTLPDSVKEVLPELKAGPGNIVQSFQRACICHPKRPGLWVNISLRQHTTPVIACEFVEPPDGPRERPNMVFEGNEEEDPKYLYFVVVQGIFQQTFAKSTKEFAKVQWWKHAEIDNDTGLWRVNSAMGFYSEEPFIPVDDCLITVGTLPLNEWIYIIDYRHHTRRRQLTLEACLPNTE